MSQMPTMPNVRVAPKAVDPLHAIAIIGNPWYRYFFAELAARLKRHHGTVVHVYCASEAGCRIFREADRHGAFDSIAVAPSSVTYQPDATLDRDAVVARAQDLERRYDLNFNHLAVTDRLFGRGYAPGGFHHPRSRQSERGSYVDLLHTYSEQIDFWAKQYAEKPVGMVMEVNHPVHAIMAYRHGAIVRNPTPSRHKNLYYWTTDEYGYCGTVEQVFKDISVPDPGVDLEGVPYQSGMFNREAVARYSLAGTAKEIVNQLSMHARWRIRGHHKSRNYIPSEFVRLALRRRRFYRMQSGPDMGRLADLHGQRFVFYAMHVEPELWFQGRSPENFYQLSTIISLSRDLPAGVLLAVKEHLPGIGRRPDEFYDQIRELKNVVLLNVNERGQDIVRAADAIATISGTVGQEAAVLGKPVISFGRHNLFNILPHVQVVTREEELRPALQWALSADFDGHAARQAGLRFLSAICRLSFDMKKFTARTLEGFDAESVETAYRQLLVSLGRQEQADAVRAVASGD